MPTGSYAQSPTNGDQMDTHTAPAMVDYPLPTLPCVLADVAKERHRLDDACGGLLPEHSDEDAFVLLGQQFGQVAYALHSDPLNVYAALVPVAAVTLAWLERVHDNYPEGDR